MDRELTQYLPAAIAGLAEMAGIAAGQQPELARLHAELGAALDDQFLSSASERGIARWEQSLGMHPKGTATLDERRFAVLAHLIESLPFTVRMLHKLLSGLVGERNYELDLQHKQYKLDVRVALHAENSLEAVRDLLHRVTPANMIVLLDLLWCTHTQLGGYTHAELARYTHQSLREGVIMNG